MKTRASCSQWQCGVIANFALSMIDDLDITINLPGSEENASSSEDEIDVDFNQMEQNSSQGLKRYKSRKNLQVTFEAPCSSDTSQGSTPLNEGLGLYNTITGSASLKQGQGPYLSYTGSMPLKEGLGPYMPETDNYY